MKQCEICENQLKYYQKFYCSEDCYTEAKKQRMKGAGNNFYGRRHTKETKKKLKQMNTGKRFSPETEFKKGQVPWNKDKKGVQEAWNKGKKCQWLENEKNGNWRGDKAGYKPKHIWVKKYYGKPIKCEHCGAMSDKKLIEWCNKDHEYKRIRSDWMTLCRKCHMQYDIKYNNRHKNKFSNIGLAHTHSNRSK